LPRSDDRIADFRNRSSDRAYRDGADTTRISGHMPGEIRMSAETPGAPGRIQAGRRPCSSWRQSK